MIHQRIKSVMANQAMSQAELSAKTGIGKSGISQYLSGKVKPGKQALTAIADTLKVSVEWLTDETEANTGTAVNLPVTKAARLMGVSPQFIRIGLQQGKLPFGYAVRFTGGQYRYYISPKLFAQHTGIAR